MLDWDAPRPDAFISAIARSGRQGTRASAARHALALGAREHGGTHSSLESLKVADRRLKQAICARKLIRFDRGNNHSELADCSGQAFGRRAT